MTLSRREEIILPSAARTANTLSGELEAVDVRNSVFFISVTDLAGTPSIVVSVQCKNPVTGDFIDVAAATVISSVSENIFKVGVDLGITTDANIFLSNPYKVMVTHADTDSITYSVGVCHEQSRT